MAASSPEESVIIHLQSRSNYVLRSHAVLLPEKSQHSKCYIMELNKANALHGFLKIT